MNGVFSSNTNLGFSSQGGQVSVVMTNMQTSGFSSQMPTANVNFNINKVGFNLALFPLVDSALKRT